MDFTTEHLRELARTLCAARPEGLTCEEWLDRVAGYVDARLAGAPPDPAFRAVTEHMDHCEHCREDFETILRALGDG